MFLFRMWNFEQNDNYVLLVDGSGFESGEVVNCILYNKVKGKVMQEIFSLRYCIIFWVINFGVFYVVGLGGVRMLKQ